jgi:hypothetical protein
MNWRTIRHAPTLEKAFQALKNSEAYAGMGSVTLSPKMQEELCKVAMNQFFNSSSRCEQLVAFCLWITGEKGGRIEEGTEEEIVREWANIK